MDWTRRLSSDGMGGPSEWMRTHHSGETHRPFIQAHGASSGRKRLAPVFASLRHPGLATAPSGQPTPMTGPLCPRAPAFPTRCLSFSFPLRTLLLIERLGLCAICCPTCEILVMVQLPRVMPPQSREHFSAGLSAAVQYIEAGSSPCRWQTHVSACSGAVLLRKHIVHRVSRRSRNHGPQALNDSCSSVPSLNSTNAIEKLKNSELVGPPVRSNSHSTSIARRCQHV